MDSFQPPTSSGSSLPSRDALPFSLRPKQAGPLRASDRIALVHALRQALAAGERSTDSILHAATDAARVLSGGQGTALALRTNGVIVCRARSGDIAPELGVPIDVDSGISGGCLRTATVLVCNDAATDTRVDREACVTLGVRSIVVVPIRTAMGVAGILEAFSTRPYAFGAQQIDSLKALAEIAETAYDREGLSQSPTAASVIAAAGRSSLFASRHGTDQIRTGNFSGEYSLNPRYWIPIVVAIALLLVSTAVWLSWGEPEEIAAAETPARAMGGPPEAPSGHPASRVLRLKPDPEVADRQSSRLLTKNVLQNAAEIEATTGGPHPSNSLTDLPGGSSADNARPGPTNSPDEPPPTIDVTTSNTHEVSGLSSTPAALPVFGASVSTGVTEGDLIHRVDPTYPPEARVQKLAGSVVLDATVAEDGSIHEVRVVSGAPLLAAAATAAVGQWRYRPSLLSGKAIAAQKRITIVFKLQ